MRDVSQVLRAPGYENDGSPCTWGHRIGSYVTRQYLNGNENAPCTLEAPDPGSYKLQALRER